MGIRVKVPQFYADSVVVAYRVPASDLPADQASGQVTSSGGSSDFAFLMTATCQVRPATERAGG